MRLLLDLETVSLAEADEFLEPVEAPSNYKDPLKIDAYVQQKRVELLGKAALEPDLCRIVAIGYQLEDSPVTVMTARGLNDVEELTLVEHAWRMVTQAEAIIGFNILSFDLPVLIRRSQYLGISVPALALSLDRYRTSHVDLLERLSFNGKLKYRSLDFYCKRFGVDVSDTHSGKDIDGLVKAGEWEAVEAHCRADIDKTRGLAERLGLLTPQAAMEAF